MRNVPDTFFARTPDTDAGLSMLLDAFDKGRIPANTVTNDHVQKSSSLQRVAAQYVAAFTQNGNTFLASLHSQLKSGRTLSIGQARAALNTLLKDYVALQKERNSLLAPKTDDPFSDTPAAPVQAPEAPEAPATPVTPHVEDGIYTVVLDETGTYRTLRFKAVDAEAQRKYNVPEGTQIISYLSGDDNDNSYTGFAYAFGTKLQVWRKFGKAAELQVAARFMLEADKAARADYGHAYALQSGRCYRCNRRLTVPASIHRGLGPDCAEKM